VDFGELFLQELKNLPVDTQKTIAAFVAHVRIYGLIGLQGRNKPSCFVPRKDPDHTAKVAYAQGNNLHHYHIGIPTYSSSKNGDVSDFMIHYQLIPHGGSHKVKIVWYGAHKPRFKLPEPQHLA
jgi:hypothetical protein